MIKPAIAALTLCAFFGAPVMAQPVQTITASDGPPTASQTSVSKDGKICRILVVTGSRVPQQKICLTKAEWDAKSDGAKEGLDSLTRNGLSRNCVGLPGGACGQ